MVACGGDGSYGCSRSSFLLEETRVQTYTDCTGGRKFSLDRVGSGPSLVTRHLVASGRQRLFPLRDTRAVAKAREQSAEEGSLRRGSLKY